jgi:hypothetical protein
VSPYELGIRRIGPKSRPIPDRFARSRVSKLSFPEGALPSDTSMVRGAEVA